MTTREERLITEALALVKYWETHGFNVAPGNIEYELALACYNLLTERAARLPKPGEVDIIRDSPNDITLRPEFDQRTGKRRMG